MRRYANRRDANEADIVDALEKIGCTVYRMDLPVDLLVGDCGENILFEIKDGNKPPSKTKRTEVQRKFMEDWPGQVAVIKSVDEAIEWITERRLNRID